MASSECNDAPRLCGHAAATYAAAPPLSTPATATAALAGDPAYRRRFRRGREHSASADPSTAHDYISVVEHHSLPRRNRPLWLVECYDSPTALHPNLRIRRLMAMANRGLHANGSIERFACNPVQPMSMKNSGTQMIVVPNNHLPLVSAQFDHIQRRSSSDSESLALANGEVVNARMMTDNLAHSSHQLARRIRQLLALLIEIRVDESLVIATWDKANLL